MKTLSLILFTSIAAAISAAADLDLPRNSFPIAELEEAKAYAIEKEKPLIFVDTWLSLGWGKTFVVGSATLDAFKSTGVFVLVDGKMKDEAYHGKIPRELYKAISGGSLVKPLVVITNSDGSKPIHGYSATGHSEDSVKKLAREIRKQIKDDPSLVTGGISTAEDETTDSDESDSDLLVESRSWTNIQGKTITAAVVSIDELNVVFQLASGKNTTYPIENLSEQSQSILKEMTE